MSNNQYLHLFSKLKLDFSDDIASADKPKFTKTNIGISGVYKVKPSQIEVNIKQDTKKKIYSNFLKLFFLNRNKITQGYKYKYK